VVNRAGMSRAPEEAMRIARAARWSLPIALAAVLVACSTAPTREQEQEKVQGAVTAPLNDLNLVRVPIPPLLQEAQRHPYQVPEQGTCETAVLEIMLLDDILGPDIDEPAAQGDKVSVEHAQALANDAAIGALRRTAEGVVPFRSWVRKLTGAERHSREVSAAISAGTARRAFLKGLRKGRECTDK